MTDYVRLDSTWFLRCFGTLGNICIIVVEAYLRTFGFLSQLESHDLHLKVHVDLKLKQRAAC